MRLVRPDPLFRLAGVIALIAAPLGGAFAENKPAPAASPPVSSEPQNTAASYGDWTVRCQRTGDGAQAPRLCDMEQTLQMQNQQGQQSPVAQIALGRASPKDPIKLVVTLPTNVSFPSSVKFTIDDKDNQPIELAWLRCLPGGCYAAADFKDDDAKRWKAQAGNGRLQFKDGAGRDQAWPFSFRGFAQAMDGLGKS
jgi:invasion protein IalB